MNNSTSNVDDVSNDIRDDISDTAEDVLPDLEVEQSSLCSSNKEKSYELHGRRIVDIQHLWKSLKQLKHNGFGCDFYDIDIISEKRCGLGSIFLTKCKMCNVSSSFSTYSTSEDRLNINKSAICGAYASGIGYTQFTELFSALNIPLISSHTYVSNEKEIQRDIIELAQKNFLQAGVEEAALALEAGEVDVDGLPMITVIVDGAWSKRSYKTNYNALSGVACIIGARTNKILHLGVKNKYCFTCSRHDNAKEVPVHKCYKNWNRTSTSMEAEIIVEGFNSSISVHKLKYAKIIGDGDSSVYKKICQARPYGPNFYIQKIECRNHVLRNFCNKMKEIVKVPKMDAKVRTFLKNNILRSRIGIVSAIRYRKAQPLSEEEKVQLLKKDILCGPKHVMGYHVDCKANGEYFCKGAKPGEENIYNLFSKGPGFDLFTSAINRVAANASSLLYDVDNNYAENYNSQVNKIVGGKRVNFSLSGGYEARCYAAALNFNKEPFVLLLQMDCSGYTEIYTRQFYASKLNKKRKQTKKYKKTFADCDNDYGGDDVDYIPDKNVEELEKLKQDFVHELNACDIAEIERKTRKQSSNSHWHKERSVRITASNFGRVCKMRNTTSTANSVKYILYPSDIKTKALEYGSSNEKHAIKAFENQYGLIVEECGLFVDFEFPYLAASPDGLIGTADIIEVKCPYAARDMTVAEGVRQKVIDFCVIDDEGQIRLKKSHKYMYQIQGQLRMTQRETCNFFIFTQKDNCLMKIKKDDEFWGKNMQNQLRKFYFGAILPELLDSRLKRNLPIRDIQCQHLL